MKKRYLASRALPVLTIALLSACGGGGGGGSTPTPTPTPTPAPAAPSVSLGFAIKQLQFSWDAVAGATSYRLLENADGASGFTQVGDDIASTQTSVTLDIAVHKLDWNNASYIVEACNSGGCTDSTAVAVKSGMLQTIGYFKASNTDANDNFGASIALSADGSTMAVGAPFESSSATGINGDQANNDANESGAVYVFTHADDGTWSQQAYIKASNTGANDRFGSSVALSSDGSTLAVGAIGESSSAKNIDGNQDDNSAASSGAVYAFTRVGTVWTQQAYIKASNTDNSDSFGYSITLAADGDTLAVGAFCEDSSATGIDNNQSDNSLSCSGAAYVFKRIGTAWSQQAYIKASNAGNLDYFGSAVALSSDGATLAVGAPWESSNATGVGGDQGNDSLTQAGAVYVFTYAMGAWTQQAYIKASNPNVDDQFGLSVSLSADGGTLAVGAPYQDTGDKGIHSYQYFGSSGPGAVYMFARTNNVWAQQSYLKASNTDALDDFGISVTLSSAGNTLAVGALNESSSATGIDGDQSDNSATDSGAVYVFSREETVWSQQTYVKAPNTGAEDYFGVPVALSADNGTLAVGAFQESSDAKGVGGDESNNGAQYSGSINLY